MNNLSKSKRLAICVIVAVTVILVTISAVNQSKKSKVVTPTVITNTPAPTMVVSTPEPAPQTKIVLMDNEYITLSYEEMYETGDAINIFCMVVYATNKSDKKVRIMFKDATINDEMTNIICGQSVLPGKSGRFVCTIDPELLSIDNVDQVKNMEFNIRITDENFENLVDPQKVKLDF